jgi:hypothetical protein
MPYHAATRARTNRATSPLDKRAEVDGSLGIRTPKASNRLPAVKDASWVRDPVDRFILARLERENLSLRLKPAKRNSCGECRWS